MRITAKELENLRNQISDLSHENDLLKDRIFQKCRRYKFFVPVSIKMKCYECGKPTDAVFFSAQERAELIKTVLVCEDCTDDIPF